MNTPNVKHTLISEYDRLCADCLPIPSPTSIWRFNRLPSVTDLDQGWKLHVSATVLTASDVLRRVADVLQLSEARYKAPASLQTLHQINSGLAYGYSQVGKFITVYPQSPEEALLLAERLDKVTAGFVAPRIPFDRHYRVGSCVYYRYGAFKRREIPNANGANTPVIRTPDGSLVPDDRQSTAQPAWVSDPFARNQNVDEPNVGSLLSTQFRVFEALAQRGKGGVYKAYNLGMSPPVLCVLKEGRPGGEVGWDQLDGVARIRQEEQVLRSLNEAGIPVPKVYSCFETEGNYYLALEYMKGETLQSLLYKRQRKLPLKRALEFASSLSSLIMSIHSAGWAWRDCKPANIMITKAGVLRPFDFEGACRADCRETSRWGTAGFSPAVKVDSDRHAEAKCDDLYALGAIIYLLLKGTVPEQPSANPDQKLERQIPTQLRDIISDLLSADSGKRPDACLVNSQLRQLLADYQPARLRRRARS